MSGRAFHYLDGSIEYELSCNVCGAAFRCRDDSFYSWPVLCSAAEAEGWRIRPGMEDEHECAECALAAAAPDDHRRLIAA